MPLPLPSCARSLVRRRAPRAGLWLVAALTGLGLAASGASAQRPIGLPDVESEVHAPGALGDRPHARIGLRLRNRGPVAARVTGAELEARWADGSPAGTVEREGPLPGPLRPGHSAWVRFRWERPEPEPPGDEPVLFFGCATVAGIDLDPGNDCDVELAARRPSREVVGDDFDEADPRWEWWTSGTGFSEVRDGLGVFTVTDQSHAGEYSDAEINDYRGGPGGSFPWQPGLWMEIRARSSDDNSNFSSVGQGTRGFGFWNLGRGGPGDPDGMTNAWFISVSKETLGLPRGLFLATVFDRGEVRLLQPLAVNISQWHTYGVAWTPLGVTFVVDGRSVATVPKGPPDPLGFVAWIDNMRILLGGGGFGIGHLDLERDERLYVDTLRIRTFGKARRAPR